MARQRSRAKAYFVATLLLAAMFPIMSGISGRDTTKIRDLTQRVFTLTWSTRWRCSAWPWRWPAGGVQGRRLAAGQRGGGLGAAWLLATDLPATIARCSNYCKRAWCEQSRRDEKGHGFNWHHLSRVRDPEHAGRVLLVIGLTTLLCLSLGTLAIKRGLRKLPEPARRRLGVSQPGPRWLRDCLANGNGRDCRCQPDLYPP